MNNLALFASGSGSNAEEIMKYFQDHESIRVVLVCSNNSDAFVLERAKKFNVPCHVFDRTEFRSEESLLPVLKRYGVTHIILAGFLWLVPQSLTNSFENKILNIHPALLPNYGGKGMYGMNVHKAVIEAREKQSGITIHFVNARYDEGNIVFQKHCEVLPEDSPEDLAQRIHGLEHKFFSKVIEQVINAS